MGALHRGHTALIEQACRSGIPVVASVFVNPTQFGPREDFAKYPRALERDVQLAWAAGANAVFAPSAECIYPNGLEHARHEASAWPLPAVARSPQLEDAIRPGHFGGVCQVVARLFDLAKPSVAIFGEKDFQQLRVLTDMVAESDGRWGALAVHAGPTVRDPDGLALSSRNQYLRPEQRDQALGLVRALRAGAQQATASDAEAIMHATLKQHGLAVDYAVVRSSTTLLPERGARSQRALIAARLDTVRLIDNAVFSAVGHDA
jgi:pantoate--beta-alanine ligase